MTSTDDATTAAALERLEQAAENPTLVLQFQGRADLGFGAQTIRHVEVDCADLALALGLTKRATELEAALRNESALHRVELRPRRYDNGAWGCGVYSHENNGGCVYWQDVDRLLAALSPSPVAARGHRP